MSLISVQWAMRGSRRRLAVLLMVLGLGGAVAVHHAMPMDMHAMAGHSVCLAVLAAGALLVAAAFAVRRVRPRPPRRTSVRIPASRPVACCWSTPARAGPLYLRLSVLRL